MQYCFEIEYALNNVTLANLFFKRSFAIDTYSIFFKYWN